MEAGAVSQFREPNNDNPFTYMLDEAFTGLLRSLMICLPGRITAFDPTQQRAQVECGIQRLSGGNTPMTIQPIQNVPVQFSGDSEWYHFHQITPGETEGLIYFTQRAADVWLNQGGPTAPTDFRMFDAKDAFFAPGFRSAPRAIPGFPNDGAGISNYAGSTRIHAQDGIITMTAGGQTLTLDSSGLKHNGTDVGDTHTHPQGPDSDSNTQQDTGTPQ